MSSRTNYYDFRDAKVLIAMELSKRGWEIFGFKPDESDSMTDYWSPADWDGIATKNGYVVVIDCSDYIVGSRSGKKDYRRSNSAEEIELTVEIQQKIKKLKEIRQDRGASPAEEATAKEKIEKLLAKDKENKDNSTSITVYYPTFQANPPRMSWHVEKDGVIIAKGNGVAKFSRLHYFDKEEAEKSLEKYEKGSYRYEEVEKKLKLYKNFLTFINKIDTAAGSMLAKDGKGFVYENVVETKYKTENKAVECAGSLKNGQCFIVKSCFNHGIGKGYVYQLNEHETNGEKYYIAYRLDKKLKKQLTGNGNRANCFGYISGSYKERFLKWIETGALAWCEIQEVKTPYEVTKCVKKAI
jgi:hypothetical protein